MNLNTKTVHTPQVATMFVKPLSYEFRVVENLDKDGKISKVALEYKFFEHDEHGYPTPLSDWMEVPRIKRDHTGLLL
jgi:hypothetical protein